MWTSLWALSSTCMLLALGVTYAIWRGMEMWWLWWVDLRAGVCHDYDIESLDPGL